LLLDLDAVPEDRFRHNLLEIIDIENFNPKKPAPISSKNEVKKIEDVKPVETEFKQVQLETKEKPIVHQVEY
jgi:hypothetical protein